MPIRGTELGEFAPLIRFGERVADSWADQPEAYIRLRIKPAAGNPYSIGQVRSDQRAHMIDEVIDRIVAANSTEPVLVEFMGVGGRTMLDYTELPPLFEAYENAMQARMDVAKTQGESQVLIAAFELIARQSHTMMHQANGMHSRWLDSEDRMLEHKETLLDVLYARPDPEPDDPDARKWIEMRKAFESVFGGPVRELGTVLRPLAAQQIATRTGVAQPTPQPTPQPAPAPTNGTGEAPGDSPAPSAEDLADTTVKWLGDILEHRPDLMTLDRLQTLTPHREQLRMALALLDAAETPPPPDVQPAPKPEDSDGESDAEAATDDEPIEPYPGVPEAVKPKDAPAAPEAEQSGESTPKDTPKDDGEGEE